jgi:hypothetical protein
MPRRRPALDRVAREARLAAISAIYQHLTDAERRKFMEWQKKNVRSGGKLSAFDWPGLKPYLQALADDFEVESKRAA